MKRTPVDFGTLYTCVSMFYTRGVSDQRIRWSGKKNSQGPALTACHADIVKMMVKNKRIGEKESLGLDKLKKQIQSHINFLVK